MSNVISIPQIPNKDQIVYTYEFDIEFSDPDNSKVKVKPIAIVQVYKECDYESTFNPIHIMALQFKRSDVFILKRIRKTL
jgi:hypothetical protein